ncbi:MULTISPECIES: TolC family protein [Roseivirga]|jgi:outer membrane protein|uniref:Transporter n=1 Tax=Roseivirga thermotolerans TaxID=1758176 RepID=A0ABQ3I8L2_9BACT|nr:MULTISPECIES: TolC family protein [Roseivirga]MEC7754189.1 TolC family protein [Bacteroidota bacterium]GHE60163.1 transporter [Roseivirga thermotolerans]
MKKILSIALLLLMAMPGVFAQKVLTLEECIDIALQNNIALKRARNSAEIARAQYTQSKFNFLPSLSAGASHNWFEGLSFDQTSGNLVNTTTLSGGGSIGASMTLFDGFSNLLGMQQAKASYEAAEENVKSTVQLTQANVVNAFLQVVTTKESLKINEALRELLQEQLEREEIRERAGVGNMEQVYNFRSQIAQQDLVIVNNRNTLESSKLQLIQLLLLDPSEEYSFEGITLNDSLLEQELQNYNEVHEKAMSFSPGVRSAELSLEASRKAMQSAKYLWMPNLSISAGYGTSWSSNLRDQTDGSVIDLSTQFDNNRRKSASLNLNIPLFNNFRNRTQMQTSKIQMLNSELGLEQAKNDLTNQLQRAYLDLVNAKTTYGAAKQSQLNLNQSFEFAKTRYENGTIDFVTYLQSLNAKNRGDFEMLRSKYSIYLRKLILDIYMGELISPTNN